MFEPLRELLPEDPQALVDDPRILGEKAGRLFGSRSTDAYTALGGAVYAPLHFANEGVVGWASSGVDDGDRDASSAASSMSVAADSSSSSSAESWLMALLSWLGSAGDASSGGSAQRRALLRRTRRQRRQGGVGSQRSSCRRGGGGPLLATRLVRAAPHILPHLLRSAVRAAAFAFPVLRTAFPAALPDAAALLAARQSAPCRGPERVAALSFHPLYLWLAVAVDEGAADGSARVVLYDAAVERVAAVLTHAFQKDVNWLGWKPYATDVLAVGCRGGVLLWSLSTADGEGAAVARAGGAGGPPLAHVESSARALFYRTYAGFDLTAAAFSNRHGSMLACASVTDTRLKLLNLQQPPFSPHAVAATVVPSVEGGVQAVLFDDDDLFLLCAICEHPSLAIVRCAVPSPSSAAAAAANAAAPTQVSVVPVPAPVQCVARAAGLGGSLYFLAMKGLEGVLLARVNVFTGLEVVALISTGIYRGVGGCVTSLACSRRRLWVHTETNHVVVCRYGDQRGEVTVLPVGVAAMEAVALVSFSGCTTGSLVAVLEEDGCVSLIPSYHS